jgi:hypothetical protein
MRYRQKQFLQQLLVGRSGWFPGPFRICLYRVRCLRRLPPGTDAKAPRHSSNPRALSPFGLAGVGDLGPTKCYPLAGTWQRLSGRNRAARCPTRKACPTTSNASSQIARAASGESRRGILSWMLKRQRPPNVLEACRARTSLSNELGGPCRVRPSSVVVLNIQTMHLIGNRFRGDHRWTVGFLPSFAFGGAPAGVGLRKIPSIRFLLIAVVMACVRS